MNKVKNHNISSKSSPNPSVTSKATAHPLLDENAVANKLGVSPATLQAWRCTGRVYLPFIKVGRLVRYRQEDIDAFIAANMAYLAN